MLGSYLATCYVGGAALFEGIYSITFRGAADWGMGMFILQGGKLTGADAAGVLYDGGYSEQDGQLVLDVTMRVPPGVGLVQGVPPQQKPYDVHFVARIPPEAIETQSPVLLSLPPGPVNVIFRWLRQ